MSRGPRSDPGHMCNDWGTYGPHLGSLCVTTLSSHSTWVPEVVISLECVWKIYPGQKTGEEVAAVYVW